MIKYIKSVFWRVAKCLSYIEEARCLKVKVTVILSNWKKERREGGRKEGSNEVNMTINLITLPSKTTVYLDVYTSPPCTHFGLPHVRIKR